MIFETDYVELRYLVNAVVVYIMSLLRLRSFTLARGLT